MVGIWLTRMFLHFPCATDPKCTIYVIVWQGKIWNDKLQTDEDETQLDIKLHSNSWNCISRSVHEISKSISEFKFILSSILIHLSFHLFFDSGTFASSRTQIIPKVVKTVWQKADIKFFSMRGGAIVFDGISVKRCLQKCFCDEKILTGNLY